MKECSECNCEMIDDCKVVGQHPLEFSPKEKTYVSILVPTGKKITLLGMQVDATNKFRLKARMYPKCGKIELYADLTNSRN